jgi:hypothetical protein
MSENQKCQSFMKDAFVGTLYTDTGNLISVGDKVLIDLPPGKVTGIFLRGTKEAAGCYCEDTGALAVLFDDGVDVLFPFGNSHAVTTIEPNTPTSGTSSANGK